MARQLSRRRLSAHLSPLAAALVAVWPLQSVLAQPAPTALPSPAAGRESMPAQPARALRLGFP